MFENNFCLSVACFIVFTEYQTDEREFSAPLMAYLHAAICRADFSAPRNREANRRV